MTQRYWSMVIVFDLDDTLYDEIEFVKSGFREIASYLGDESLFPFMMDLFYEEGSGRVLNKLIERYQIDISLQKLIEIYRFHRPKISLDRETLQLLEFASQFPTALVTDGHYLTQRNKFEVLGLDRYIDYPIFTDFHHTNKPQEKPFKMIMNYFLDHNQFVYVSDNPKKDFIGPHKLGWSTIRYKNPQGIYRDFKNDALFETEQKTDIIRILKEL